MSNLDIKKDKVADLKDKFAQAKTVVVTDYRGLNVAEVTKLRSKLREAGVEYKVAKNTLLKRAIEDAGLEAMDDILQGPTAIAFSYEDLVAPAQVLAKFAKEHKKLEIKGGLLEGKIISLTEVKALAELPSREVLLTQVASALQSPLVGMVNVLQGPLRKTVYALEEIRKQKEA